MKTELINVCDGCGDRERRREVKDDSFQFEQTWNTKRICSCLCASMVYALPCS